MTSVRTLQRSFAGGEIAPELYGRLDLTKYQTGLATCENFIVLPHGPVASRPGLEYIKPVKTAGKATRLIPFAFSTTQTYALEFGDQYIRFFTQGGQLLTGTVNVYRTHKTVGSITAGVVNVAAHGLTVNEPVIFTPSGGGTLPPELTANTIYYVVYIDANQFQVSRTAGGSAIVTSGAITGTVYVNYGYSLADMVTASGITYYCISTPPADKNTSATLYWYALTGSIVEVPSPYLEADLFNLHFVQSADVLTIVHPGYAPRELRRLGATKWVLSTISFTPTITAPTGLAVSASPASGSVVNKYVVTAVASDGLEESIASASVSATNDLTVSGNRNTLTWTAVSGAVRYNIYKQRNGGIYGYAGQTNSATAGFSDNNIVPDTSITPPESQNPFPGAGDYPGAVSYFEQRRCFAGTLNKPQNLWLTRSATESNMNYSIPTQADDAIVVKVAAREANTIRHLVPLSDLVMLTSGGEWKCGSGSADALEPTTIQIKPQAYQGASNVSPIVTGNSILYSQDRGARIREISYSWEAQTYKTVDLSLMAPHLFDGYTLVDMAFMRSPFPVLWAVRSDGVLLGMTYVPDQQVIAWHQHPIDGVVESVCVIAEGTEDVLYVIARRTINGSAVRYVERLHSRQFTDQEDAFFVDCGLSYNGAPATTISGLVHLEGETVVALADGAVVEGLTVTSGAITLPAAASVVHIGLPIEARLKTLPLAMEAPAFGQGRVKNVSSAWLRVYRSGGIFVGPTADRLTEYKQRTNEVWGTAPALKSDEIEVVLTPTWSNGGELFVVHDTPTPMTLVSMSLEVAVGG
jgi:hypothetical protein